MPNLLTLAAMKSYALSRRAKWKDYVDLYFILKKFNILAKISQKAKKIFGLFGREFNEKTFREQLAYFEDIDYSEEIIYKNYKNKFKISNEIIKKELIQFSLE